MDSLEGLDWEVLWFVRITQQDGHSKGLTAAQLGPTLSVPPRSLETKGWNHCLLSPKARVLLSN